MNESLRNAVRVTVIATGFDRDRPAGDATTGDGAKRLGPLGTNGGNGEAATGTDGDRRRLGFVRRIWGHRSDR